MSESPGKGEAISNAQLPGALVADGVTSEAAVQEGLLQGVAVTGSMNAVQQSHIWSAGLQDVCLHCGAAMTARLGCDTAAHGSMGSMGPYIH